jgi:two-component system, cell cycle sensor histidine kinase and response regulator CckA
MDAKDQKAFDEDVAKGFPVILLAEDELTVRNLLLVMLRGASYAVLVAANGQEALALSRGFDGEIALLLTDMEMPGMGGDELTELVMRERPGIRILQMSGRPAESFPSRNVSLAFLPKPFERSVLMQKIVEVLDAPVVNRRSVSEEAST